MKPRVQRINEDEGGGRTKGYGRKKMIDFITVNMNYGFEKVDDFIDFTIGCRRKG